jgi:hypothetical protein
MLLKGIERRRRSQLPDHSSHSLHCISAAPTALDRYLTVRRLPDRSSHSLFRSRSFETRSRPRLTHALPRISTVRFAHLCRSRSPRLHSLAAALATLPSMSLFPKAPFALSGLPIYVAASQHAPFARFDEAGARNGPIFATCCAREHVKRAIFVAL